MNQFKDSIIRMMAISRRELRVFKRRPLFLFTMTIAPILCAIFFTTLMKAGLPTKLPCGLVDLDDTRITHIATRILGSMQEIDIKYRYASFQDAQDAMERGDIYGFFYIPRHLTKDAESSRQPKLSFYTNDTYFVPANLSMKDMRYISEMAGLGMTRETLYQKGLTEDQAMAVIQPIVLETHPLNNAYLDYSVYLTNILVPGILILLIMISTCYTIGIEWKENTQMELYEMSGRSSTVALMGKLFPQTCLYILLFIFYDVYFYKILLFPCNVPLWHMMLLGAITVLASQAFGVFLFAILAGQMRLTMCLCCLVGILSFSLAGFTYPVTAMDEPLQWLSWIFPLRHYFLVYINQALDGNSIVYAWKSLVSYLVFLLLPLTVLWRYKAAFLKYKYKI